MKYLLAEFKFDDNRGKFLERGPKSNANTQERTQANKEFEEKAKAMAEVIKETHQDLDELNETVLEQLVHATLDLIVNSDELSENVVYKVTTDLANELGLDPDEFLEKLKLKTDKLVYAEKPENGEMDLVLDIEYDKDSDDGDNILDEDEFTATINKEGVKGKYEALVGDNDATNQVDNGTETLLASEAQKGAAVLLSAMRPAWELVREGVKDNAYDRAKAWKEANADKITDEAGKKNIQGNWDKFVSYQVAFAGVDNVDKLATEFTDEDIDLIIDINKVFIKLDESWIEDFKAIGESPDLLASPDPAGELAARGVSAQQQGLNSTNQEINRQRKESSDLMSYLSRDEYDHMIALSKDDKYIGDRDGFKQQLAKDVFVPKVNGAIDNYFSSKVDELRSLIAGKKNITNKLARFDFAPPPLMRDAIDLLPPIDPGQIGYYEQIQNEIIRLAGANKDQIATFRKGRSVLLLSKDVLKGSLESAVNVLAIEPRNLEKNYRPLGETNLTEAMKDPNLTSEQMKLIEADAALAKELFELAQYAQSRGWSAEQMLRGENRKRERAWRRAEKSQAARQKKDRK